MKLAPEFVEAVGNVYEVCTTLFGDPPTLDWEMQIVPTSFGPEVRVRLFVTGRARSQWALTLAGVIGGIGEMHHVTRALRALKHRALARPVDWRESMWQRGRCA